jgi:myxalamid-type polyketide synthase MxaE and MxaD
MPSGIALTALGSVLASGVPQAVVANIDWSTLKPLYETRRRKPMLELVSSSNSAKTDPAETTRRDLESVLASIPAADRLNYVTSVVREEAAAVLGLKPEEVDTGAGLFNMGMDSLMSVELKRRLELRSSRSLRSTLTFNYPTVEALGLYLFELLAPATPAEPEPAPVRDDREELSEEQLESLLLEALKTTS